MWSFTIEKPVTLGQRILELAAEREVRPSEIDTFNFLLNFVVTSLQFRNQICIRATKFGNEVTADR
jgi:hypothetical protein